jgi:MoaA/NifB/PqqE/SkfB family radical SAM enzyme
MTLEEWSKQNEFNSFNSWKGLLYADWYKAIIRKNFLPPVEASLDPIHQCNLLCEHCNAHSYLTDKKLKQRRMPDDHLMNLVRFLGRWGVKAICFGGGGEPTLHTKLADAIKLTTKLGMEASVATNGTLFNEKLLNALILCRWVGISIDAATPQTYKKGRKEDLFDTAISNMSSLVKRIKKTKSNCDVAFKFLIFDYNQHEIYDACKLAKKTGVRDFHARPADFSHQGMGKKKKAIHYDIDLILKQFEKCHLLENEKFRVFTVMHKFDEQFKPRKDFGKCYAAPLCIQLCADGNIYFCPDTRHKKEFLLGRHYPHPENILKIWGKNKHKKLVFGATPAVCDTRCTFAPYNKQCENLFTGKDPMCWRFI